MPPRFAYWTIILSGKPTAFRAQDREELLPTFKQLQNRHPDVVMKWFARGRLWESPEEARAAQQRGGRETRPAGWRPGGEHRDPRARFKVPRDEKRRRFAANLRRDRTERDVSGAPGEGPSGADRKPFRQGPKTGGDRRPFARKGPEDRVSGPPREGPGGADRKPFRQGPKTGGDRRPFERKGPKDRDRPAGRRDGRPFSNQPRRDRGPGRGDRKPGGGGGRGGGGRGSA